MSDAYDEPGSAREMGCDPQTGEIYEPKVPTGNPLVDLFPHADDPLPPEIAKAIIAVKKRCKHVGKTGENLRQDYSYSSAEDVLKIVQPAMAEAGLILRMWPVDITSAMKGGIAMVIYALQWAHEGGSVSGAFPWVGLAQGGNDKWFNITSTATTKYALLRAFHIPAGGEPDADADEPAPAAAEKPPARAKATRGSSKKAEKPAGPTDDEIAKLLPKKPGFITVPHDTMADGSEAPNWELWGRMLSVAIQRSQEITDVNAWMDANTQPLKNMALKKPDGGDKPQWRDRLLKIADFRRSTIAQAPAPEDAV